MKLFLPRNYRPALPIELNEQAVHSIKSAFEDELARNLRLRRVAAPLFVFGGTGINDDLNGTERAVWFPIKNMDDRRAEIVHSLAKWKRVRLASYRIPPGNGIYTDMRAIRADEELDNIHSLYVDQWDWEVTIQPRDRTLDYLKGVATTVYESIRAVEEEMPRIVPQSRPTLPPQLTFIHSEDLLAQYPDLPPRERENAAAKAHRAIFIIGIGATLANGEKHDGRAPDYDDWSTPTDEGHKGLNGDIILWDPVLESSLEISSMGIRVDKAALLRQLELEGCVERQSLDFHKALLDGRLPLSIGGGIGQSRLCMFFLKSAHIGEVQASLWPDAMREQCKRYNILLK